MNFDYDAINIQYRLNDIERWKDMDFVLGYNINLSNNPKPKCDLCKLLSGQYPKSFIWTGWHDGCKCFTTAIMEDFYSKEKSDDRVSRLRASLLATTYEKPQSKNEILYVPRNFIEWFLENRKVMYESNSFPHFVTDNIELIMSSYNHYNNITNQNT